MLLRVEGKKEGGKEGRKEEMEEGRKEEEEAFLVWYRLQQVGRREEDMHTKHVTLK